MDINDVKTARFSWIFTLLLAGLVAFNTVRVNNLTNTWTKTEMNEWVFKYREALHNWVDDIRTKNPDWKIPKAPVVPHIRLADE